MSAVVSIAMLAAAFCVAWCAAGRLRASGMAEAFRRDPATRAAGARQGVEGHLLLLLALWMAVAAGSVWGRLSWCA